MGLSAAHAQQRTRDILFPRLCKRPDQFKGPVQTAKPAEALISSPQALRARILKPQAVAAHLHLPLLHKSGHQQQCRLFQNPMLNRWKGIERAGGLHKGSNT